MDIFVELSTIVIIATIVSFAMKLLKQPFVVGYILTGIVVGPQLLNIAGSKTDIELFSKIGIVTLLFIVGLHLNPAVVKEAGRTSIVTGLGQVLFTSIIGYFVCLTLGFSSTVSLYIAIALTFSSTIIILKLLSDKDDLTKLYGRISIGFLLVQDLVATVILVSISTLTSSSGQGLLNYLLNTAVKGLLVAILFIVLIKLIVPKLLNVAASSLELLFLFSLGWGLGIAALFHSIGFSIEIGALIAGICLSSTPFAYEIGSRLKPLRDFFILIFFISLGSQMVLSEVPHILLPAIILSIFVLVGNPIIVIVLMNLLGFKLKTSFFAGLTVAQISEFSLILVSLGVSVGHIPSWAASLTTLIGLITITASTYMILYANKLYPVLEPLLRKLELRTVGRDKHHSSVPSPEILLFGYDRVGTDFVTAIEKINRPFLVVDYNPQSIKRLIERSIPNAFGDAEDVEFLAEIGLYSAKLIVSTIPNHDVNKQLIRLAINNNPKTIIVVLSHTTKEAQELYSEGATYVVMPHYLGAEFASHLITKHGLNKDMFLEEQRLHKQRLEHRLNEPV